MAGYVCVRGRRQGVRERGRWQGTCVYVVGVTALGSGRVDVVVRVCVRDWSHWVGDKARWRGTSVYVAAGKGSEKGGVGRVRLCTSSETQR